MFEETMRALRRLEMQTTVSVPFSGDEEGYIDRECPSEGCLFQFKVFGDDWKDKVRNEEVFCPFCGYVADANKWWTHEQIEHAQQAALAQIKSDLGKALTRDAGRWNQQQSRNSFISMTMKVDGRAQHVPLPPAAAEPMQLKIACPACACRYAVIGAAYFCPACGHNAADLVFAMTIAGIRKSINALDAVRSAIPDRDTAESTARLIVENGLQNAVTALQRCVEALFTTIPSAPKPRRNAFQNLAEGSQLWQAAGGGGYANHLSDEELRRLNRAVQQRHLLAHKQGVVDDDYLAKSGDTQYRPGQRIVVKADAVNDAVNLIEKLIAGLQVDHDRLVT